jgi:hypothetical protein
MENTNTHYITLTNNQAYFLYTFMSNMSTDDYRLMIENNYYYDEFNKKILLDLLEDVNNNNNNNIYKEKDITYDIWEKLHRLDIMHPKKSKVIKYQYLYKDFEYDISWKITEHLSSAEEDNMVATYPNRVTKILDNTRIEE